MTRNPLSLQWPNGSFLQYATPQTAEKPFKETDKILAVKLAERKAWEGPKGGRGGRGGGGYGGGGGGGARNPDDWVCDRCGYGCRERANTVDRHLVMAIVSVLPRSLPVSITTITAAAIPTLRDGGSATNARSVVRKTRSYNIPCAMSLHRCANPTLASAKHVPMS